MYHCILIWHVPCKIITGMYKFIRPLKLSGSGPKIYQLYLVQWSPLCIVGNMVTHCYINHWYKQNWNTKIWHSLGHKCVIGNCHLNLFFWLFWPFWSGELLSSLLLKSSLKSLGPFAGMLNSWYFIKFMFLVPTRNSTWTNDVMKRKIWLAAISKIFFSETIGQIWLWFCVKAHYMVLY